MSGFAYAWSALAGFESLLLLLCERMKPYCRPHRCPARRGRYNSHLSHAYAVPSASWHCFPGHESCEIRWTKRSRERKEGMHGERGRDRERESGE